MDTIELTRVIISNDSVLQPMFKIVTSSQDHGFLESNYISLISIAIATFALIVSWRVLSVTKKHNRLSLRPFLIFRVNTAKSYKKVELYISNKGMGPLVIDKFIYKYDNIEYESIYELTKKIKEKFNFTKNDFDELYNSTVYPLQGYALLPDEKKTILRYYLKNKTDKETLQYFEEVKNIEFLYKCHDISVHDFEKANHEQPFNLRDFFIVNNKPENEDLD